MVSSVTVLNGPFIVLLEQDCPDEAGDGGLVGKDADDIGASPFFSRSSRLVECSLVR